MKQELRDRVKDQTRRALEQAPPSFQADMLTEECAELILALRHLSRGKVGLRAVIEELADVEIMINTYKEMLGLNDSIEYEKIIVQKLDKWDNQLDPE